MVRWSEALSRAQLCDPKDYRVHGILQARTPESVDFPFSGGRGGGLPNPGIQPMSPALQADSLPAEPQGKPKNTGMVAYPFSSRSFWPRNWTGVPALQTDSLPTEWSGKPCSQLNSLLCIPWRQQRQLPWSRKALVKNFRQWDRGRERREKVFLNIKYWLCIYGL